MSYSTPTKIKHLLYGCKLILYSPKTNTSSVVIMTNTRVISLDNQKVNTQHVLHTNQFRYTKTIHELITYMNFENLLETCEFRELDGWTWQTLIQSYIYQELV